MGDLKFDPFSTNAAPVFAPIKLKRFARLEHQRHIGAASCRLLRTLPTSSPCPGKSRHALIRSVITKLTRSSYISFTVRVVLCVTYVPEQATKLIADLHKDPTC